MATVDYFLRSCSIVAKAFQRRKVHSIKTDERRSRISNGSRYILANAQEYRFEFCESHRLAKINCPYNMGRERAEILGNSMETNKVPTGIKAWKKNRCRRDLLMDANRSILLREIFTLEGIKWCREMLLSPMSNSFFSLLSYPQIEKYSFRTVNT
jgi:hypothetical protein